MPRGARSVGFQRRHGLISPRDAASLGEGQMAETGLCGKQTSPALRRGFSTPVLSLHTLQPGKSSVSGPAVQALTQRGRPPQPNPRGKNGLVCAPPPFDATLGGSRIAGNNTSSPPAPPEQYFALLWRSIATAFPWLETTPRPCSATHHGVLRSSLTHRFVNKEQNTTKLNTP